MIVSQKKAKTKSNGSLSQTVCQAEAHTVISSENERAGAAICFFIESPPSTFQNIPGRYILARAFLFPLGAVLRQGY